MPPGCLLLCVPGVVVFWLLCSLVVRSERSCLRCGLCIVPRAAPGIPPAFTGRRPRGVAPTYITVPYAYGNGNPVGIDRDRVVRRRAIAASIVLCITKEKHSSFDCSISLSAARVGFSCNMLYYVVCVQYVFARASAPAGVRHTRPHGTRKMRAPSHVAFSPVPPVLFRFGL